MPVTMKPSNNVNKQFYPIKLPNLEAVKKGVKTEADRVKSSKVASFSHNIIKSVAGLAYDFTQDYAPDMIGTFKTMKEVVTEAKKETVTFKDTLKSRFSSRKSKSLNADQLTDYIAEQTADIMKRLKKGELYKTRDARIEEAIRKEFPDLAELENEFGDLGDTPSSDTYETVSDDDVLSPEPFGGVKKGKTRRVNVSAKQRAQRAKSPTRRTGRKSGTSSVVGQLLTTSTAPSDTGLSGQIASTATTNVGKALLDQNEAVSARSGALSEFHFNKLYTYQNGILKGVNEIVNFNNNVTSKQIASQLEFQGKNLALMQDTFNSIKELKDAIITLNGYGDTLKKDDKLAQAADSIESNVDDNSAFDSSNGKLNIKNYIKNVKQNISRELSKSTVGNVLLTTSMADNLLGDDNIAKESMSIMDMISNALFRSTFTRRTTTRIKELSEAYKNFIPMMLGKARGAAEFGNTPLKRMLGRLLTDNTAESIDIFKGMGLGDTVDNAYRWTKKSDRTLNEVIPTLLAKQLSVMSGTDELYYDYKTGKFLNTKILESKFNRKLTNTIVGSKNLNVSGLMAKNVSNIIGAESTEGMSNNDKYLHDNLAGTKPQDVVKYMNSIVANVTKSNKPYYPQEVFDSDGNLSSYGLELASDVPADKKIAMMHAFTLQYVKMSDRERAQFTSRALAQIIKAQPEITNLVKDIEKNTGALSTIYEGSKASSAALKLQELNYGSKYKLDNTHRLSSKYNLETLEERNRAIDEFVEEYHLPVETYTNKNGDTKFRVVGKGSTSSNDGMDTSFSTEGNIQNIYKLLVNGIVVYPQGGEIPKNLQDLRKRIWNKPDVRTNLEKYEADRLIRNAEFYSLSKEREMYASEYENNPLALLGIGRKNDVKKNANLVNRGANFIASKLEGVLNLFGSGVKGGRGLIDGQNNADRLALSSISGQLESADIMRSTIDDAASFISNIPILRTLSSPILGLAGKFADSRRQQAIQQAKDARAIVGMDDDEVYAYIKSKGNPEKQQEILEKCRQKGLFGKLTDKIKKFIDVELNEASEFDINENDLAIANKNREENSSEASQAQNVSPGGNTSSSQPQQPPAVPEVKAVSRANREIKPDFSTSSVGMKSIYDILVNGIVVYNRKEIPKNLAKLRTNLFKYDDKKIADAENKAKPKGDIEEALSTIGNNNDKDQLKNEFDEIISSDGYVNKHLNYGKQMKTFLSGFDRHDKFYNLRTMMYANGYIDSMKWNKEILYASILGLEPDKLEAIRGTDEFRKLERAIKKGQKKGQFWINDNDREMASAIAKKVVPGVKMLLKGTGHFKKIIKLLYNRQHLIDPDDNFDVYKLTKPELIAYVTSLPEKEEEDKAFKDAIMATDEWKDLINGYSFFKPKNLIKALQKPFKAIWEQVMTKGVNPFRMVLRKTLPFKNLLELMKLYMQNRATSDPSLGYKLNDVYKWTPYQLYANILAIPDDDFENAKFKKALMTDETFYKLEKFVNDGGGGIIKSAIKTVKKIKKNIKFGINSNVIFGKIRRYRNIVWFLSHQKGYEHTIDITEPGLILALLDSWANDESEMNGTKNSRQLIYKSLKSSKEYMELEAAAEFAVEPKGGRSLTQIRKGKNKIRKERNKILSKYKVLTTTLSIQGYDFQDLKDSNTLKNTIDSLEDEKTRTYLQSTSEYKKLAAECNKENFGGSIKDLTNTLKKGNTRTPTIDASKIKNAELRHRFETRMKEFELEGEKSVKESVKALTKLKQKYVEEMNRAGIPTDDNSFFNFLKMWGGAGLWGISGKGTQLGDKFYTDKDYEKGEDGEWHKTKDRERIDRFNDLDEEIMKDLRVNMKGMSDQSIIEQFEKHKGSEYVKRLKIKDMTTAHEEEMLGELNSQKKEYVDRLKPSEDDAASTRSRMNHLKALYRNGKNIQACVEQAEANFGEMIARAVDDKSKLEELREFKKSIKPIIDRIDEYATKLKKARDETYRREGSSGVSRYENNQFKKCLSILQSLRKWKKSIDKTIKDSLKSTMANKIRRALDADTAQIRAEEKREEQREKRRKRKEKLHQTVENVKNGVKNGIDNAAEKARSVKEGVTDKAHQIGEAYDNFEDRLVNGVSDELNFAGMNARIGYDMTRDKIKNGILNLKIGREIIRDKLEQSRLGQAIANRRGKAKPTNETYEQFQERVNNSGPAFYPGNLTLDAVRESVAGIEAAAAAKPYLFSRVKGLFDTQRFAKGGIVQGPTEGDKVPIKANGGEMLLTGEQQTGLFGFLKHMGNKVANGKLSTKGKDLISHVTGKLLKIPKVRRSDKKTEDTNEMNEAYSRAFRMSKDRVFAVLTAIATGINRQNDTSRLISRILGLNEKGEIDEKNKEAYPSLFYKMINGIKKIKSGDGDGGGGSLLDTLKGGLVKGGLFAGVAGLLAAGIGTVWGAKRFKERSEKEGAVQAAFKWNSSQDYDSEGNKKSYIEQVADRLSDPTAIGKNAVDGVNTLRNTAKLSKSITKGAAKGGAWLGSKGAQLASKVAPNATKAAAGAVKSGASVVVKSLTDLVGKIMDKIAWIFTKLPCGEAISKGMSKITKVITEALEKAATKLGMKGASTAAAKSAGKSIPFANIFLSAWDLAHSAYSGWTDAAKLYCVEDSAVDFKMRTTSVLVHVVPSIISGALSMLSSLVTAGTLGAGAAVGVGLGIAAVGVDIIRAFIDMKWLTNKIYKIFANDSELEKLEKNRQSYAELAESYGTDAERYADYQNSHRGFVNSVVDFFSDKDKIAARDATVLYGDDPQAMEKYKELKEKEAKREEDIKNLPYKKGSQLIDNIANYAQLAITGSKDWYAIYNQWCAGGKLGILAAKAVKNAISYRLKKAELDKIYNDASDSAKLRIKAFGPSDVKTFLSSKECANAIADGFCVDNTPAPEAVSKNKPGFFSWLGDKLFGGNEESNNTYDDSLEVSIANKVSKLAEAFMRYFFKVTGIESIEPLSSLGIRQNSFVSDVRIVIHKEMIDAKKRSDQEQKFNYQAEKGKINGGPNGSYNDKNITGGDDSLSDRGYSSSIPSKNNQTGGSGYTGPNNFKYTTDFKREFDTKESAVDAGKAKEEEMKSSPSLMEEFKSKYPNISKINNYNDANKVFHDKDHYNDVKREVLTLLNSGDTGLIAYFANKVGEGWNHGPKIKDVNSLDPEFREKINAMMSSKFNDNGQLDENGKTLADMGIGIRETLRSPLLQLAYFSKSRAGNSVTDMLMKMAGVPEGWNWGKNYGAITWTLGSEHANGTAIDFDIKESDSNQIRMLGNAAKSQNLNWGGNWDKKDYPHIQKFAKGGIIHGPLEGDRVPIKANGGEMVLTRPQQTVLFGFLKDIANKYVKGEPVAKLKKNPFAVSDERTIEMINEALEIQKKIYEEQVRHDGVTEKLLSAIVTLMQALGGGGTLGPAGGVSKRRIRENIQEISSTLTNGALANASGL